MAGVTVKLAGVARKIKLNTLSIDKRIEQRSTAKFVVYDEAGSLSFPQATPVQIYDASMNLVFGGFVSKPDRQSLWPDSGILHSILCSDNHYLADKILVVEAYVSGTTAGAIVQDLFDKYLVYEGITVGQIQTGPTLKDAVFNHVSVSLALDAVKEASGTYTWYISADKKLYFVDRSTRSAAWDLDGSTHKPLHGSIKLSTGNDLYRNVQYVWGGTALTGELVQNFTGDGSEKTFLLNFPLAEEPEIEEDSVACTVGIKGIDENCDYYWTKGDPVIYADVAPGSGVDVEVTYKGQYPFIGAAIDGDGVLSRATLESSSGRVEDIVREAQNETRDTARQSASAKISQYCQDAEKFRYSTYDAGLEEGTLQDVTFSPFGFSSHEMLIEAIKISMSGNNMKYDVSCVTGPIVGDWTKFFVRLLQRQDQSIRIGGELLLKLMLKDESLTLVEDPDLRNFDYGAGDTDGRITLDNDEFHRWFRHEGLDLSESPDLTDQTTEDYVWMPYAHPQDCKWDFATWG